MRYFVSRLSSRRLSTTFSISYDLILSISSRTKIDSRWLDRDRLKKSVSETSFNCATNSTKWIRQWSKSFKRYARRSTFFKILKNSTNYWLSFLFSIAMKRISYSRWSRIRVWSFVFVKRDWCLSSYWCLAFIWAKAMTFETSMRTIIRRSFKLRSKVYDDRMKWYKRCENELKKVVKLVSTSLINLTFRAML